MYIAHQINILSSPIKESTDPSGTPFFRSWRLRAERSSRAGDTKKNNGKIGTNHPQHLTKKFTFAPPFVLADASHAPDLLSKMRIHFE